MGSDHQPIDRLMLFQNYGSGDKPISQWVDDVEIWNGMPGHTNVAAAASTVPETEGHDALAASAGTGHDSLHASHINADLIWH